MRFNRKQKKAASFIRPPFLFLYVFSIGQGNVELSEVHKFLYTLIYFAFAEAYESLGAELLYRKRGHG